MSRFALKLLIVIAGFLSSSEICVARKVPGYILTENLDTIYGEVKVYSFDRITGDLIINGIDLQSYHLEVEFKSHDGKKFITFKPQDIQGFGFFYKSEKYIFRRFLIEQKSIVKSERQFYRFLNLLYNGKISLYKDIIRVNNPSYDLTKAISYVYSDYYLYDTPGGLKKVRVKEDDESLKDILSYYGFEDDYLNSIPKNTNLKDIQTVLEDYDSWYKKNKEQGI